MRIVYTLAILFLFALVHHLRFVISDRRQRLQSWAELSKRSFEIDIVSVRAIAECYLRPCLDQLRFDPRDMFKMVGGLSGLEKLKQNAETMIDFAVHAEQWNNEDGRVISAMMRRDGRRLRQAIWKFQCSFVFQYRINASGIHLQEAIASYYLMRGRLLGAYERCQAGRVTDLARMF